MALPMLGGEGGPWQKPTVEARNKDGRHPPVLVLPTRRWGGDFSRQSQTSTGPQRATRETFPICGGKSSRSEGNCVHRTLTGYARSASSTGPRFIKPRFGIEGDPNKAPTASRSISRGTCSAPDRAGYGYGARTARSWGALFSRSCRRTWRGARTAACSSPRRARAFTGCRRRRAGHCSAREELPLEQEENEMTEKTILKTLLPLLPPVTNLNLIVGGCAVAESIRVEYQRNRSDGTGRIHARRRYRLHHLEPSGEAERDLGRSRGRVLRCAYRLND